MNLKSYKERVLPMKHKLYRFALSIVCDRAEAADVVQEVCIKLWDRWQEIDRIDNLEAWSMRLVKNQAIDALRSKHRRTGDLEQAFHLEVDGPTPYQAAAANDEIARIRRLMARLPEQQRFVMHLRDIEGLSYREIAEALDLSMPQVKVNLFRARKQMRSFLTKSEPHGSPSH